MFVIARFFFDLLKPLLAVLGRRGEAFADGVRDVVDVQVSPVDHAVHCHFGEAVEPHLYLPDLPGPQRVVDGIEDPHVVYAHLLQNSSSAILECVPVAIAVLVEEIHVSEPLISPSLREDGILVQLFLQDLLPDIRLSVLIIVAAGIEEAIFTATSLAGDGMVDGLDIDASLEVRVVLAELTQEDVGISLGCRDEQSHRADLGLRDGKLGNYLNFLQLLQRLEGIRGDEKASNMHFLPVAVVGLDDVALCVIRSRSGYDESFGPDELGYFCPFGQ